MDRIETLRELAKKARDKGGDLPLIDLHDACSPDYVLKLLEVVDKAREVVSAYDAMANTPTAQFTGREMPRCEAADAALRSSLSALEK